jgi:deferrochelatase/peroxidase EfeB
MDNYNWLDEPIPAERLKELEPVLSDLQGNILRSHGRDHSVHIFLRFLNAKSAKDLIARIEPHITSAQKQLLDSEKYKESGKRIPGDLFWSFFLSSSGYEKLEIPKENWPEDKAFQLGMVKRRTSQDASSQHSAETPPLHNDPPQETWGERYRDPNRIDAMLLIAHKDEQDLPWAAQDPWEKQLTKLEEYLLKKLGCRVQELTEVCAIEYGRVIRNESETKYSKIPKSDGSKAPMGGTAGDSTNRRYEHFGYVDSHSQPLFFKQDIIEKKDGGGIDRWDPAAKPSLVLVKEPERASYHEGRPTYGSYLVFRKLEQKVDCFEAYLKELTDKLKPTELDRRRAEALVMGRFRDGTPIVLQASAGQNEQEPMPNNFDFGDDPQGMQCPFQAHIRKMNPRGELDSTIRGAVDAARRGLRAKREPENDILNRLRETLERLSMKGQELDNLLQSAQDITYDERYSGGDDRYRHEGRYRIARRSVPYGTPDDPEVGLLFMCYQSDIGQQFERLQGKWASSADFPVEATGPDAIIGPGDLQASHTWPQRSNARRPRRGDDGRLLRWNKDKERSVPLDFKSCIALKGGEYFFVPSLPFLRYIAKVGAP